MINANACKLIAVCGFLAAATTSYAQDALFVNPQGDVGIGTNFPEASLHVSRWNGTASILLQETQSIQTNVMFTMRHNGNPGFRMHNTAVNETWEFRMGGGGGGSSQFMVNRTASAGPEFTVLASGNVRIKGSYLTGSSKLLKQDFTSIQPEQILQKLTDLPLYEWSYISAPDARHFGPMAEEFHEIFNLAGGGTALAATDVASLAVAGIQAVNMKAKHLDQENQMLKAQLEAITNQAEIFAREKQILNDRLDVLEAIINGNK